MRRLVPWALALLVFGGTALAHWRLGGCGAAACAPQGEPEDACPPCGPAAGYWESGEGFIGLSYGLGFGFLALVVGERLSAARRGGLRASVGGLAGAGLVWLALCWLAAPAALCDVARRRVPGHHPAARPRAHGGVGGPQRGADAAFPPQGLRLRRLCHCEGGGR